MQPRKYPPILPSAPLPQERELWRSNAGPRRLRPGACTDCRHRKIKCDGVRPRCSNCVKRGVISCLYIDKTKAGPETLEVLELLKTLPEEQATKLLSLLRENGDPVEVLSIFRESNAEADEPTSPEAGPQGFNLARSVLELELMTNNSKAYPPLRPVNASLLANSDLLRPSKPSATVYETSGDSPSPVGAASAGRRFLLPQNRFCSRFLFHALMYLGCQMYSAFDKDAIQYADKFCEEAERLWKEEQGSCLTMAGAVLLSLSLIGNGRNHAVLYYATQAMKLGEGLGLFSTEESASASLSEKISEDDACARSYAAWGTFNWNVLISLFYRQPGSESPSTTPILPIPGEPPPERRENTIPEGYLNDSDLLGWIFPAVCRFWRVIHGVGWIYNPVRDVPSPHFRMALAEHGFRELIAWAGALPPSLLRIEGRSQHVTVLHIWLHSAILDIFRPFVGKPVDQRPRLTTFSAQDSTPDAVYAASVGQLKHLVVEYRSYSVASTYSILWHTGLLYLANAMLKDTGDPEWRLYMLLCIYGYESFSRPFRISEIIVQGLLSMTMRDNSMTGSEAQRIINELKEGRLDGVKRDFEDKIRAKFMVDMDLALRDPEEARAENLAAEFDTLALFQDFLDYDQMQEG
ncbi:uncharacterized protein F4822DRAFT_364701 [Hypoxylon trugodes]|uniref:uncharacterized protein n=1 Tax=Hypoxylon trugodes TaxID=326681 RepID=UPI00219A44A6|nr:uncharacterized protein F4822DRAFT_364701 [Hypoxylon trugodes]KAI1384473.1 hypothetical protein F4822DRAFT_364701 [Hypoxylon trugodes]